MITVTENTVNVTYSSLGEVLNSQKNLIIKFLRLKMQKLGEPP